jgi:hypothetical protein
MYKGYVTEWTKKYKLIQELGGKCVICGNNDFRILIFHHTKEKQNSISSLKGRSYESMLCESKKCVLMCNNCHYEYHYLNKDVEDKRRYDSKKMLLNIKGVSECMKCGYDKFIGSLDFHHRNEITKKFTISEINKCSKIEELGQVLIDELEKCDVLCKNCHQLIHINTDEIEKNLSKITSLKIRKNKRAPVDKILELHSKGYKTNIISKETNTPINTISDLLKRKGLLKN